MKSIEERLAAGETAGDIAASEGLDYDAETDAVLEPGWYADDGGAEVYYEHADSGREAAQEYVDDGDWGDGNESFATQIHVWREGWSLNTEGEAVVVTVREDTHTITWEPDEPECGDAEHDWQSPYEIVGGIEDNPGVWGNGGGVIIHEICMRCGITKITDTWAQNGGIQGLTSVRYDIAEHYDDWAEYCAQEDEAQP